MSFGNTHQQLLQLQQNTAAPSQADIILVLTLLSDEINQVRQHNYQQQQKLDAFERLLEEKSRLQGTVKALEAEISALKAAAASPTVPAPTNVLTPKETQTPKSRATDPLQGLPTVKDSSWATVAKKHAKAPVKRSQPSERRVAAATRAFTVSVGEQGYNYVYIPHGRHMNRPEVHKLLRTLGFDTGCILDVCFPARSVIGLLVHLQYEPEVLSLLEKAGITTYKDFDPTAPEHLADPKYATLSKEDLDSEAIHLHESRCLQAIAYMRPHTAFSVATAFAEVGWIEESQIPENPNKRKQ